MEPGAPVWLDDEDLTTCAAQFGPPIIVATIGSSCTVLLCAFWVVMTLTFLRVPEATSTDASSPHGALVAHLLSTGRCGQLRRIRLCESHARRSKTEDQAEASDLDAALAGR